MTIDLSSNNPRVVYTVGATPQTDFVIPFSFFASSDVNVYVDGVLQTGGSDYVLSGDNADESPIVFTVAVSNCEVAVTRDVPLERTTDFNIGASFNGPALNDQLDRITAQIADIDDKASRAIQLNDHETGSSTVLPDRELLKGNTLAFDETTGDIKAGPSVQQVLDVPVHAAAAAASAAAASVSEVNASSSATAAGISETNAASSADSATSSASLALQSELTAGSFAGASTTSAMNSAASEAAAATSATNAATSETNAAASETNAATSATNAATSETNAATSATTAAGSATSASTSATNASTSETNAATSATNAATSEANAATSATSAVSSATSATSSASAASTSASNAATSETNAATSETNAATSESNAATSATNAATSATNASTSATSAATSATNAAASYDSFDDRYLGPKASAPTADNDGDALLEGALYWNTTTKQLYIWDGTTWDAAAFSASGTVTSFNTRTGAITLSASDVNTALGSDAVLDNDIGVTVQAHSAVLDATTASYTSAEETKLAGIEVGATADQTITAGGGLTGGGIGNVTIGHADTSSAGNMSVNNSGGTVLQDLSVTFDDYGHVTGTSFASANLDDRYFQDNNMSFRFAPEGQGNLTTYPKYFKVATVNNDASGGVHLKGHLNNHVESFGTQDFDISIYGREANNGGNIEITGYFNVGESGVGVYVIKTDDTPTYHPYDVYIVLTRFSQVFVDVTKTGMTTLVENHAGTTTQPTGISTELDTSSYSEGSYVIVDSVVHKNWHAGNDGSGSGLDADLLDGIDSGSFKRSDQSGHTAEFGPWYNTVTYIYDATNGTRYYWLLLGTIGDSSKGSIEYEAKDDANYPYFVKGTIAFSNHSGASGTASIQHDQHTADPFGVQVRLDTSRRIWIRIPTCDWNSYFRFRVHNDTSFTTNTSWSTGTTRYDTLTVVTPPNSSADILSGQNLRAVLPNVSGSVPTYQLTNYFGNVYARQGMEVAGNTVWHAGNDSAVKSVGIGQSWANYNSSRSSGVSYRNTTGRPIYVHIADDGSPQFQVSANNSTWITIGDMSYYGNIGAVIPPNYYYRLTSGTERWWTELR